MEYQKQIKTSSTSRQRSAYDALVAGRGSQEGFDASQIGLEGLIPIRDTAERINYQ